MTQTLGPNNPQNTPPTVYINEFAVNPSTPGAQPIKRQVVGVGASQAVSAQFQPATQYVQLNPQFLTSGIAGAGTVSVSYAVGNPPFTNGSISTALTAAVVVAVGQGQCAAFIASGSPLNS